MENLLGKALTELKKTTNPGNVLNELYNQLFSARYSTETLIQFRRLSRNYGRFRVYFALAKMADSYFGREDQLNTENPFPLVSAIIRSDLADQLAIEMQKEDSSLQAYVDDVFQKQVFLTTLLQELEGISVVPSKGGTYLFPKLTWDIKDEKVAKCLIKNHGILVTPGSAYGSTYSQGYLRFVTLTTKEALAKGVTALEKTLTDLT